MPAVYDERLTTLEFPKHCPARAILREPNNILQMPDPATNADRRTILRMATQNIWTYGRQKQWAWGIMPNPGNKARFDRRLIEKRQILLPDGVPPAPLGGNRVSSTALILEGWGLLAGISSWDNCAGFNSSLIFLARHVFGFANVEKAAISGDYITARVPNGTIDPLYEPTVRTFSRSYNEVHLYFFTGHEFVKFDNRYFDVTTNTVFDQAHTYALAGHQSDGKYCDLTRINTPAIRQQYPRREVFNVSNANLVTNGEIGMDNGMGKRLYKVIDNKYNHWSGYLLTAMPDVPERLLERFRGVGGIEKREPANKVPMGRTVAFHRWGMRMHVKG
jgi:hypothetical protein